MAIVDLYANNDNNNEDDDGDMTDQQYLVTWEVVLEISLSQVLSMHQIYVQAYESYDDAKSYNVSNDDDDDT